jgi:hypothetical protein
MQSDFLQREKPEGLIRIQAGGGAKRNPCKLISFNVKARRADKNTGRRWSEAKPLQTDRNRK